MPQYTSNPPLHRTDLLPDPLAQFERWMKEAEGAQLVEPTAMSLATIDANGRPSVRVVLFKGLHGGGFTFFTNYESRKGQALAARPFASANFWWDKLERQVRIEGRVERVSAELSDQYFHLRPRGSQIGSYASRQSRVVANRAELDARVAATAERFEDQEVPCPPNWGGFRIVPDAIEFWQGRLDRVHDRFLYRREGSAWRIDRLEP